jgi:Domain of unknown function (DUF4440)
MKFIARPLICLLLVFVVNAFGQAGHTKPTRAEKDTAELIKLTRAVSLDSVQKDAAALERLMDDDFVMLGVSDRYFHKRDLIGLWTKKNTDAAVAESSTPTDIRVFLFGQTAIVTSVITDVVTTKGVNAVTRSRPFDVWMRSRKGWRWISSRETLLAEK